MQENIEVKTVEMKLYRARKWIKNIGRRKSFYDALFKRRLAQLYIRFYKSNERESMEEHLYECDHCLALYMESIDEQQENLPMINDDSFTNEVMTQIDFETLQPIENVKQTH